MLDVGLRSTAVWIILAPDVVVNTHNVNQRLQEMLKTELCDCVTKAMSEVL
jgi:hypothetical protein